MLCLILTNLEAWKSYPIRVAVSSSERLCKASLTFTIRQNILFEG